MFVPFRRYFSERKTQDVAARAAGSVGRRLNRRRPTLESLEARQMMSLGAEFTATVNTTTRNDQFGSANASSSNGSSVAVWVDTFSPTDHDIRAQRFNAAGQKTGPEILVSGSTNDEYQPAVAMDSHGDFVVSWTQAQPGGDTNVVARRFDASGNPVGALVQVGAGTFTEHNPSVAMDGQGDFIVAYTRDTNYTTDHSQDVFAKRYDVNNNLLQVVNVAVTTADETNASVAETPDGRFDVSYEKTFNSNDHDIYLNRYSASGALLGANTVAASTAFEARPSVSLDNNANAVVAFQRDNIFGSSIVAKRISSTGVPSNEIVLKLDSESLRGPKVALKRGGGAFVVTYDDFIGAGVVQVAEVSSSNRVTTFSVSNRSNPSVSINGADNYLLTYTSSPFGDRNILRRIGHL